MINLCEHIVNHFALSMRLVGLPPYSWYLIAGRAGPNAVLKIVIPPRRDMEGYVLSCARHTQTPVLSHEVTVLSQLADRLPQGLRDSIPKILLHSRIKELEYSVTPFYRSRQGHRIANRLTRRRRWKWVEDWLAEIAVYTTGGSLTEKFLELEYAPTISRIQQDPRVPTEAKLRVRESFEKICDSAKYIPSICCHGDLWSGNILWRSRPQGAVVLDWVAARWPGLPCVDLCRFALGTCNSDGRVADAIRRYCRRIGLDPVLVPPLYDLYNVFVKAESDATCALQPDASFDPFVVGSRFDRLVRVLGAYS